MRSFEKDCEGLIEHQLTSSIFHLAIYGALPKPQNAQISVYQNFNNIWTFWARVTAFLKFFFTIHLYRISAAVKKMKNR